MLENLPRSILLMGLFLISLNYLGLFSSIHFYTDAFTQGIFFVSLFLISYIISFNLKNNF